MTRKKQSFFDMDALILLLAGLLAYLPFLLVRYPPIQDMPFHEATLRIVHNAHDPAFGFGGVFDVHLLGTPYVVFYMLGDILAYALGVRGAVLALVFVQMIGVLFGLRLLLRSLDQDMRLALFAAPISINCLTIMGFFPFLLGVTFLLFALALAVEDVRAPSKGSGIALALVSCLLFYTHIIPVVILAMTAAVLFPYTRTRKWVRTFVPYVPLVLLLVHWLFLTESGKFVTRGVSGEASDRWSLAVSLHNLYDVTFNMFPDGGDERTVAVLVVVAVGAAILATQRKQSALMWRWALVPIATGLAFFFSEGSVGYTGFLRDRFPLLALLCAIPLFRFPDGLKGHVVTAALLVTTGLATETNLWHFRHFESDEVGDFSRIVELIPPKKRVMGLVFEAHSELVERFPFLHYASYYQGEKGGVVQYSFADIPHWVVKYQPHSAPPLAAPKRKLWEWEAMHVTAEEEIELYYDYVIVRDLHERVPPRDFRVVHQGGGWAVWERRP